MFFFFLFFVSHGNLRSQGGSVGFLQVEELRNIQTILVRIHGSVNIFDISPSVSQRLSTDVNQFVRTCVHYLDIS